MVQMRIGKIGLQKFSYERKVPNVEDAKYGCRRREEIVRYVLMECTVQGNEKDNVGARG